jgi:hypothetical protein
MSPTVELFEKPFMLTGENIDPKNMDFTFYTQEKVVRNPDGTPALKEYYMNYNPGTGVFSDLAVRCTYTYQTQPVETRTEDIEWFFEDGMVGTTRQLVQVLES